MLWSREQREGLPDTSGSKCFALRAAAFLLLLGLISLSTQAKTSQYLAKANPAHHVSKDSKMSAKSHEGLVEDVTLSRVWSDFGLSAPEPALHFPAERVFLAREGALREALKDRSPPPSSR